jgi:hypothetical protein
MLPFNLLGNVTSFTKLFSTSYLPTSWCILFFDGENISFDASLVIYINSTNIPPIMITNRIYENQNLVTVACFLPGWAKDYQHPCTCKTTKTRSQYIITPRKYQNRNNHSWQIFGFLVSWPITVTFGTSGKRYCIINLSMRHIDIQWRMQESGTENTYLTTLLTVFKLVWSIAVGKPKYFTGKYRVSTFS